MTEKVYKYLPARLREAVRRCTELREIYEIRLRASLPLTVASNEGNLIINIKGEPSDEANALYVSEGEISACINLLCEGSAYRHERTMREGFIVTDDGLRAGLSGDLYIPEGGSFSFDSFKGVNIRIPRYITGASEGLIRFFSIHSLSSTLIFSPPGHGKTTLIRELAVRLSRGECSSGGYKRFGKVCVIDHRGEIFPTQSNYCRRGLMLDIISGCTKAKGIDIATRVLSPDIIICDEIGREDDCEAILSAHSSGVILFATVHGDSFEGLMRKPNIRRLCEGGAFSYAARLIADRKEGFKTVLTVKGINSI